MGRRPAQRAQGALRLSVGYGTSPEDIPAAAGRIVAAYRQQLAVCRPASA